MVGSVTLRPMSVGLAWQAPAASMCLDLAAKLCDELRRRGLNVLSIDTVWALDE
jgi:hypothetical protein